MKASLPFIITMLNHKRSWLTLSSDNLIAERIRGEVSHILILFLPTLYFILEHYPQSRRLLKKNVDSEIECCLHP
jgi:hypothetical protein